MTKTVVFIHGYMETGDCWTDWQAYFEARGFRCYRLTWIHHERGSSDEQKVATRFGDVLEAYSRLIDTLDEKPILVGHSLGGILVQKLIELDKGAAGVLLTSGPPKGIGAFQVD